MTTTVNMNIIAKNKAMKCLIDFVVSKSSFRKNNIRQIVEHINIATIEAPI